MENVRRSRLLIVSSRWIFFGSPYNNYLARIPKRLRFASHQKSSAGVRVLPLVEFLFDMAS